VIWFLVGVIVFLAALLFVYRWAAGETPRKGAFRGRGSYSGAGVVEAFREDDPHRGPADDPSNSLLQAEAGAASCRVGQVTVCYLARG